MREDYITSPSEKQFYTSTATKELDWSYEEDSTTISLEEDTEEDTEEGTQ